METAHTCAGRSPPRCEPSVPEGLPLGNRRTNCWVCAAVARRHDNAVQPSLLAFSAGAEIWGGPWTCAATETSPCAPAGHSGIGAPRLYRCSRRFEQMWTATLALHMAMGVSRRRELPAALMGRVGSCCGLGQRSSYPRYRLIGSPRGPGASAILLALVHQQCIQLECAGAAGRVGRSAPNRLARSPIAAGQLHHACFTGFVLPRSQPRPWAASPFRVGNSCHRR